MRAGALRHRVIVQQPSYPRDETNQAVATFVDVGGDIAAEVKPASGGVKWFNEAIIAEATHVVRLRWRDGLTTANRLLWVTSRDGFHRFRVLEIIAPPQNPDGRRQELIVACKETITPAEGES